jgi:hypothetical protein
MFKRTDVKVISDPVCDEPIYKVVADDFRYYDKDGFELNRAEQKYYRRMRYPIENGILNHSCWQEPWFELTEKNNIILDHCIILHRCRYDGYAAHQLNKIKQTIHEADFIVNTKAKWGYDFALDAVNSNGNTFEVLHVEYDSNNYIEFLDSLQKFELLITTTDWTDAAQRIDQHRDQWQTLKGFDQNNWKSKFLINWDRAEYTEKTLAI